MQRGFFLGIYRQGTAGPRWVHAIEPGPRIPSHLSGTKDRIPVLHEANKAARALSSHEPKKDGRKPAGLASELGLQLICLFSFMPICNSTRCPVNRKVQKLKTENKGNGPRSGEAWLDLARRSLQRRGGHQGDSQPSALNRQQGPEDKNQRGAGGLSRAVGRARARSHSTSGVSLASPGPA